MVTLTLSPEALGGAVLVLLAACSGAPFSLAAQTQDSGALSSFIATLDASPPEASGYHTAAAAPGPEAGDVDPGLDADSGFISSDAGASTHDAAPAPVCSRIEAKLTDVCPASALAAAGIDPRYLSPSAYLQFGSYGFGPDSCSHILTVAGAPAECQCAETFTCACIHAHDSLAGYPCIMEHGEPVEARIPFADAPDGSF